MVTLPNDESSPEALAAILVRHGLLQSSSVTPEAIEAALVALYRCRRADLHSGRLAPTVEQIEALLKALKGLRMLSIVNQCLRMP